MQGGGRQLKGFTSGGVSASRVRGRAVLLFALVVTGGLGAIVTPPMADAQGASSPWYGPADRTSPADGWTFRVPVTVTNDKTWTLRDHVVAAGINFGRLLVESGWLNQTGAGGVLPRAFTLDPDSIRVVEYDRGFADFKNQEGRAIPHQFYPSLFDESTGGKRYDPKTNPIGTVTWRLTGETLPNQVRYYYVYFKSMEYGKTEPAEFHPEHAAGVRSYASGGPGQVFYLYTNGAEGRTNRVDLLGIHPETRVYFSIFENGKFVPVQEEGTQRNPVWLNETQTTQYSLPMNRFYKIYADKPILVSDRGKVAQLRSGEKASYGGGAFAMAMENLANGGLGGTYAGTHFILPAYAPEMHVISTRTGITDVRVSGGNAAVNCQPSTQLSPSQPSCRIDTTVSAGSVGWFTVEADKPVLVQYGGAIGNIHQAPSRSGAPTGTEFATATRRDDMFAATALAPSALRIYDPTNPTDQIHPMGPLAETAPGPLQVGCDKRLTLKHNGTFPENKPYFTFAVDETGRASGDVSVIMGGIPGTAASYFTGPGAKRIVATGPVAIAGHFNETVVEARKCASDGRVTTESFSVAGDYVDNRYAREADNVWWEFTASKPISVIPTRQMDTYARYVPGRVQNPDLVVGDLEFRGHLVDVRAMDRTFKTTGPDVPVNFSLVALNLGRWIGGDNLGDTVRIECESSAPEWEVEGCGSEFRLGSFDSERFRITVTPRNADPQDDADITVRAVSTGTPSVSASVNLQVFVEVTFGVGLWFDVEGGSKTIDPPISIDAGATHEYRVVMKNLGSVEDEFEIERIWAADPGQWESFITLREEPDAVEEVKRVTLAPNAVVTLVLRVTAPEDPVLNVPPELLVKATSISDAAATDKVTSATRIRADIKFTISVDARTKLGTPGEPVNFTLTLLNTGNDLVTVKLSREGLIPEGWDARITIPGSESDEITLNPNLAANATLTVTPPEGERAGSLTTIRIGAETSAGEQTRRTEESATVVVRHVHDVQVANMPEIVTRPGHVASFELDLTNLGNGDETVEVLPNTIDPLWELRTPAGPVARIGREETVRVPVAITVPEATPAQLYGVNFTLRLSREADQNVTIPIRVPAVQQLAFDVPAPIRLTPGQEWAFPVDVRNSGNVRDAAQLVADTPPGWEARFEPDVVDLAPGKGQRVMLVMNATPSTENGAHALTLRAAFSEGAPSEEDVTATIARPALFIESTNAEAAPRRGETFIVTANVENRGDMEAKDVRVALVVNGESVDVVTLGRVQPGTRQIAVLSWDVTERVKDVKVVLNPEKDSNLFDSVPDQGKIAAVQYKTGLLPAPGASLVLALAVAALAAVLVPRRWRR